MQILGNTLRSLTVAVMVLLALAIVTGSTPASASPAPAGPGGSGSGGGATLKTNPGGGGPTPCGGTNDRYTPSIDIGCKGKGNPIADALFAIIRILSDGVGLVVIGSIIVGGIQYSGSRGDPQSTAKAVTRIRSSVFALLLYIFGYAILNYIIPGQFLK